MLSSPPETEGVAERPANHGRELSPARMPIQIQNVSAFGKSAAVVQVGAGVMNAGPSDNIIPIICVF